MCFVLPLNTMNAMRVCRSVALSLICNTYIWIYSTRCLLVCREHRIMHLKSHIFTRKSPSMIHHMCVQTQLVGGGDYRRFIFFFISLVKPLSSTVVICAVVQFYFIWAATLRQYFLLFIFKMENIRLNRIAYHILLFQNFAISNHVISKNVRYSMNVFTSSL